MYKLSLLLRIEVFVKYINKYVRKIINKLYDLSAYLDWTQTTKQLSYFFS